MPETDNATKKAQTRAFVQTMVALAEAIKELGEVPSGHLYAQVMGTLSLDQYNAVIDGLVRAKLVKKSPSHLLTWIGGA